MKLSKKQYDTLNMGKWVFPSANEPISEPLDPETMNKIFRPLLPLNKKITQLKWDEFIDKNPHYTYEELSAIQGEEVTLVHKNFGDFRSIEAQLCTSYSSHILFLTDRAEELGDPFHTGNTVNMFKKSYLIDWVILKK